MIDIKYLLLGIMLLAAVSGCSKSSSRSDGDTDTDTDTGPVECDLGEYSGHFEILEQSDVATLAGYTSISGNLDIRCTSCTDLSELLCLTSVGEYMEIDDNAVLTNVDGLSALTSVGGDIAITDNEALTNLDGLGALTSVDGSLYVDSNPYLMNLDGLSGVTSIGGGLLIEGNAALKNLDGLSALTSIFIYMGDEPWDFFVIHDNDILPDCEACELLDQLVSEPTVIDVHDNLDDSCTPVPGNCP